MKGALKKLEIPECEYLTDDDSGQEVYHVRNPHALAQAAGYLKYLGGRQRTSIFFRGQSKLYRTLSPTLVRGIKRQKAQSHRITAIRAACGEITKRNRIFENVPSEAREPLLQHYGLKTSWVDLVDNLWVSLWFACQRAHTAGPLSRYLHFEQREAHSDQNPFAYILLVGADNEREDPYVPGLYRGRKTELVDLRVAAPSIFLRPHAQHGVLFRMRGSSVRRPTDYSSQIWGTLRVDLCEALAWIGSGKLTGTHALFPPAFYDRGYELLLNDSFSGNEFVGAIHHIGT